MIPWWALVIGIVAGGLVALGACVAWFIHTFKDMWG